MVTESVDPHHKVRCHCSFPISGKALPTLIQGKSLCGCAYFYCCCDYNAISLWIDYVTQHPKCTTKDVVQYLTMERDVNVPTRSVVSKALGKVRSHLCWGLQQLGFLLFNYNAMYVLLLVGQRACILLPRWIYVLA